jgi:hypothetical protein
MTAAAEFVVSAQNRKAVSMACVSWSVNPTAQDWNVGMMAVVAYVVAAHRESLALPGFALRDVLPCAREKSAGQMVVVAVVDSATWGSFVLQVPV